MSLSDCMKCWDTPCTCGYEYRLLTKKSRIEQAIVVLGISPNDTRAIDILKSITPDSHPYKD